MHPIVILGSGLAGYSLAREFRKLDRSTPLVVVTRDDGAMYSKPMLSNALAAGRTAQGLATADAPTAAARLEATVLSARDVISFDAGSQTLRFADGGQLAYSRLVLALGADPIRLPIEGDGAEAVLSVNDLTDYARFREAIGGARHVTILGAGLIGCEFANDLAAAGHEVDVIDPSPWPLARLLPQPMGEAFAQRLRDAGVRLRLGTTAASVERRPDARLRVHLADATRLDTDAVLSAVGLRPRTRLAQAAGLTVNRGIVVDRTLRTSAPDVFALGDCAEVEGLVLSFVQPLMQAARALARTLSGTPTAVRYPPMPVVVKTPAAPLAVAAPQTCPDGTWKCTPGADGSFEASFSDSSGRLLGFALLGGTAAARQALVQRLPDVLG